MKMRWRCAIGLVMAGICLGGCTGREGHEVNRGQDASAEAGWEEVSVETALVVFWGDLADNELWEEANRKGGALKIRVLNGEEMRNLIQYPKRDSRGIVYLSRREVVEIGEKQTIKGSEGLRLEMTVKPAEGGRLAVDFGRFYQVDERTGAEVGDEGQVPGVVVENGSSFVISGIREVVSADSARPVGPARVAVYVRAFRREEGLPAGAMAERETNEDAVAAIEKCGGWVKRKGDLADGVVVLAYLTYNTPPEKTDAALGRLKELKHLETLSLYRSKITDATMEELAGLTRLRELQLASTPITDAGLRQIEGLKQLESLDLNWTGVDDAGMHWLAGMAKLKLLAVQDTAVGDAGLGELAGLHGLEVLNLVGTNVTDAGLKHVLGMVKLRQLELAGTKVTDAGLKQLEVLKQLERVEVRRTKTTEAGVKRLREKLPGCFVDWGK